MSEHTPGPWREYSPTIEGIADPFYRCIEAGSGYQRGGNGFGITGYIKPEDARLIAEAPGLFEALRKFVAFHDMDHETMTGGEVQAAYDQAIDAAKSVLHKATGGDQ